MKDILFDLDGTLTDPALGITNAVMYALKRYGIEVKDRSELYGFIGPPLAASFSEYCGFSKEEGFHAVDIYREYFADKGIFENKVYDGIPEMLDMLKKSGKRLYLATSKPEIFAKKILEHFDMAKFFDDITGSELNGDRVEKSDVIAYIMEKHGLKDAVMVGDRSYDILGAKENGLVSVGVLYGYGDIKELENAGADFLAKDVAELTEILIK